MTPWRDKVALVTGGSSGLGFHIARSFAAAGARVVIAARNETTLAAAARLLAERAGREVETAAVDIQDDASVVAMIERVVSLHGRLDVLVNNAGQSSRQAILDTTADDFRRLIDLNLLGAVRITTAAARHLIAARGHVVNIVSLSGITATRFLGAYPASKHALAAYSTQLRRELCDEGLHVLSVYPGPIARDTELDARLGRSSTVDRADADRLARLPEAARKPGGGAKVPSLRAERVADDIVRACERRVAELVYPAKARWLFAIERLWPGLGDRLVRRFT